MKRKGEISIRCAIPDEANALTKIAISAKGYWNCPEHWMAIWIPQLMFTPEYFEESESWVAVDENNPSGFYTLQDINGIAWIENLWILPVYIGNGIGKQLFIHTLVIAVAVAIKPCNLKPNRMRSVFMRKWGCERLTSINMN